MSEPLVTVRNLSRTFDVSKPWLNRVLEREERRLLRAVQDVSFTIGRRETFALVGESGSGKSTVANMVVGLLPPSAGSVVIEGVDMAKTDDPVRRKALRSKIQMIFQSPYASLNPRWRVKNIIAEPIRELKLRATRAETMERVEELLRTVGLSASDGEKFPHEFSGGQRQRISIARALASEPEFLVCDEPTSALDVSVQAQVLNLMRRLQDELGLTYLFISHDMSVVRHMSDRIAVMYLGRIVEEGDTEELFARPRHPYTQLLLQTIPNIDAPRRDRELVAGEVPSPLKPPSGCTFHPRCPLATARCSAEVPQVRTLAGGRRVACHLVEEQEERVAEARELV